MTIVEKVEQFLYNKKQKYLGHTQIKLQCDIMSHLHGKISDLNRVWIAS